MKQRDTAILSKHRRAAQLLKRDLPKMQPAALKHTYATSVANAQIYMIAEEPQDDGTTYSIGFGDVQRTMPLVLIHDRDGSIRHAHAPYLSDPIQRRLVDRMQANESQWAKDRGVKPRDIRREIMSAGVDGVTRHGLNRYAPFPAMQSDLELAQAMYPTTYMHDGGEIKGRGRITPAEPDRWQKIEDNVIKSADMTLSGLRRHQKQNRQKQTHIVDANVGFDSRKAEITVDDLELYDAPVVDDDFELG